MAARRTSRANGTTSFEAVHEGGIPPTPEDVVWTSWNSSLKAAAMLGISHKRLSQLVATGDLQPYRAPDGTIRFSPDHLQNAATALAALPDDEPAKEPATIAATADHVRATTKALENAISHAESLMKLITEPLSQIQRQQEMLVERLMGRLEALEASRDEMIKSREQYLSEEAERQVIREAFAAQEKRREEVLSMMKEFVPPLKTAVERKFGLGAAGRMKAMSGFLESMDPDFIRGLLDPTNEVLEQEQREMLITALGTEFLAKVGLDETGQPLPPKDDPPVEAAEKEDTTNA